jgi:hypothetical protein
MRLRKAITVTLLATVVAGVVTLSFRSPRAPVQVDFVSLEPARITDDYSQRMSLVTLRIRNCHSAQIEFERSRIIEVQVADRWLPMPQAFYLEEMAPGASSELLFLIPTDARVCRLPLRYQTESLRWRLWRHTPEKARARIVKSPMLRKWLLPGGYPMPRPALWRQMRIETALPEAARSSSTESL